jgi:aspartyl/asparaginyl beta-hydroxylase (cupin superfamily)
MSQDFALIAQQGVAALRRGDASSARAAFDEVEAAGRGTNPLRLLLAQACTSLKDMAGAHAALDRVLAAEPTNLYALIMRGDLLTADGDPRAGVSWYQAALTQAPRAGPLPPDLIEALRRAERAQAEAGAAFEAHLGRHLQAAGVEAAAAGPRFAEALEILAGRAEVQLQQPTNFYFPGLPQRAFFERDEFEWVGPLEAAAPAICAELQAVLADDGALSPYVVPDENRPAKRHPLLADTRWSAFHFYRRGVAIPENAERCPATMAALSGLPIPHISGRSPMALFSVLRPGTHIPPHNGMINTRLICHLPLIVPPGCRLRVGNQIRAVEAGRMMIFDDSIEHEAWNDSDSTRVVLLFEIWRPELTPTEREALTTLYEAIGLYSPAEEDQGGA